MLLSFPPCSHTVNFSIYLVSLLFSAHTLPAVMAGLSLPSELDTLVMWKWNERMSTRTDMKSVLNLDRQYIGYWGITSDALTPCRFVGFLACCSV